MVYLLYGCSLLVGFSLVTFWLVCCRLFMLLCLLAAVDYLCLVVFWLVVTVDWLFVCICFVCSCLVVAFCSWVVGLVFRLVVFICVCFVVYLRSYLFHCVCVGGLLVVDFNCFRLFALFAGLVGCCLVLIARYTLFAGLF